VCGDVAAYISGSLLVCVRCTVRKWTVLKLFIRQFTCASVGE